MNTSNTVNDRQIRTGHSPSNGMMRLEVTRETQIGGKARQPGEVIEVTRSEARRFMMIDKTLFKVLVD